jgi:hypothetical protein
MANEKLKSILGEDGVAELVALMHPVSPRPPWRMVVAEEFKRFDNLVGIALLSLPSLVPLIGPQVKELLTPTLYARVVNVIGIILIIRGQYKLRQEAKAAALKRNTLP